MIVRGAPLAMLAVLLLTAMPAWADDTYQLHAVLSLTGSGAFLGQEEQQAMQLAEGVINRSGGIHGRPVHFVFHDDQSSPQVAVQLTAPLAGSGVPLIVGSSLVASCNAMAGLVRNGLF